MLVDLVFVASELANMKLLDKFKISLPPLPASPPVHAPSRSTLLQLAAVILVAVLLHFVIASPFVAGFALLVWMLKTALIYRRGSNPARWIVMLLTILSLLIILMFYGGWNGQKAGYSFLVLLLSLKYLESSSLRDYYIVCLLLFFVASSSFLFNSSPLSVALVIIYTVAVTSILFKISDPLPSTWLSAIRRAGIIMAKALPLAIVLFFFFPRISGNFGFLPSQDKIDSENQLSNSLVASDFAGSAFNSNLAFRVEFDSAIPANDQLYWRVKVMQDEQDFKWVVSMPTAEQLRRANSRAQPRKRQFDTVGYEIVHEHSSDPFAPFLDYALTQSIGTQLDDHSVYLRKQSNGVFGYRGVSDPLPNIALTGSLNPKKLLDTGSIPKARSLALLSQWRNEASSDQQLVQIAFNYFADNNFRYSLDPPSLGDDPVEEFLFDTRSGYCGHYASAFTILMRWLEIPARIVVGYQGGLKNQIGNFLEIRYSDAHAWSEVWLDGRWQRVDPTAAINPARIDFGMDAWMALQDSNSIGDNAPGRALANFLNPTGFKKAYRRMRQTWGNIGYQWNKWVINYNFDAQRQLLENLGLKKQNSRYTLVGLLICLTLMLMLFYFWQLIPKPVPVGEAQRLYLKFINRFKRHQINKTLADTPNDFAQKARQGFPGQTQEIDAITTAYLQIRYGRESDFPESDPRKTKSMESFKQQVKRFKLKSSDHQPKPG